MMVKYFRVNPNPHNCLGLLITYILLANNLDISLKGQGINISFSYKDIKKLSHNLASFEIIFFK